MFRGKENKIAHMKVVGTAVAVGAGGSCRTGSAYCFLSRRYTVFYCFKEIISGRDSGTGSVKRYSTWLEAVCEVKRGKRRGGV
jgi:hypothetical protein